MFLYSVFQIWSKADVIPSRNLISKDVSVKHSLLSVASAKDSDPTGTRTQVTRMRTWCPRPLDDGAKRTWREPSALSYSTVQRHIVDDGALAHILPNLRLKT